jgi:uncharacterized protein (DUF488 family)
LEIRKVYTIGFIKRSAEQFFEAIRKAGIRQLIDVRLNNSSQLAGFTKRNDLQYFLKAICGVNYRHELLLAPTREILNAYKKGHGSWSNYEKAFFSLMSARQVETKLPRTIFDSPTVLLCSEYTAERCHRRLVLEYLQSKWGDIEIIHI